jgi:Spy/CpxP family protein refolding chaperone
MKRTALIFACALTAAPAFANDDLCATHLQKLDDQMASQTALGEAVKQQVSDLRQQAVQAQQAGDLEACAGYAGQANTLLEKTDKGDGPAS